MFSVTVSHMDVIVYTLLTQPFETLLPKKVDILTFHTKVTVPFQKLNI